MLIVSIMLLASCSLVRLGYNHGENLTYWWLNSYIDVNSEQQPVVKRQIAQLFAWHRQTQLNDYAGLLRETQVQLAGPVTQADTLAYYAALKKRASLIVERALPALADLALSLQPQQITHLEKKLADNNEEYRKDHLHRDIDHRQAFRYKKVMKQAEYWFGDFSREQEAVIRQASDARPLQNEIWLAQRHKRQQELLALLKKIQAERPARDTTIALLKRYAQSVIEPAPDPEHQAFIDASRDSSAQLAAVIINLTTPAQKARAQKNLQKWIDNFQALAGKPA